MLKILFFVVVLLVVLFVLRKFARPAHRPPQARETEARETEDMVRCERCGVNLPKSDALCESGVCVCRPGLPCERN